MRIIPSRGHVVPGTLLSVGLGVTAVVVWTVLFIGAAGPASASCVASPTVDGDLTRADLVFVGTVTHLENRDRWATFAVEDLWKGQLDTAEVEVHAGPADPGNGMSATSSVDRTYVAGARYLVFAYDPTSHGYMATWGTSRFEDNICSATQLYAASLDTFRPATAHRVEVAPPTTTPSAASTSTSPSADRSNGMLAPWLIALGALAFVGAIGAGAFMKLRRGASPTLA